MEKQRKRMERNRMEQKEAEGPRNYPQVKSLTSFPSWMPFPSWVSFPSLRHFPIHPKNFGDSCLSLHVRAELRILWILWNFRWANLHNLLWIFWAFLHILDQNFGRE